MSQAIDIYSLILLSIGLAMDAFSVAIVAGFGLGKVKLVDSLKVSSIFGAAHIIMPILGWFLGSTVQGIIQRWDHWLAFLLLAFVGGKMLREGLDPETEEVNASDLLGFASLSCLLSLSVLMLWLLGLAFLFWIFQFSFLQ